MVAATTSAMITLAMERFFKIPSKFEDVLFFSYTIVIIVTCLLTATVVKKPKGTGDRN